LGLTAVLLLALAALPLAAADQAAAPRLFVLHQEFARPSMLKQYEETSKEFIGYVRQHHDAIPSFNFVAVAGEDYVYTFVAPIRSFADLDAINGGFGKVAQAVGEAKWGDLMKRGGQATEFIRESVLMEDPSLSYTPAQPRLKPEEERYLHVDLYYVQPGREAEADALAKEFVELFRKKGITESYRLFKVVMGPEMPLLIVTVPAKDAADYEVHNQAGMQALGAEGQALFARAFALTRRFETHGGTIRPDLSLEPMKSMPGK
jgi:hypothetical protein